MRWKEYKKCHSIDNLSPTSGVWRKHIDRGHSHCYTLKHATEIDPKKLFQGWKWENGKPVPTISDDPIVPECSMKLITCECAASKCSGRCTCKNNDVCCIELCHCESTKDQCLNPNNPSHADQIETEDD